MNNQPSIINNQSFAPPVLSQNALTVLKSRYLIKDDKGRCIETPAQMFSRVASLVARAEARYGAAEARVRQWRKDYYDLMASLRFLPNSPALMNAGRRGMLSACFVLPVEDSIEGIFEAIKQTALIQQAGGGTGFSFDRLRPTGDRVASSGGTTSGPVSFWRVFAETTEAIQQGAFRRGANMGMMSVEHPDILKFLHAKQNLKAFTNFNISVKVTDAWMEKVLKSGRSPHVVINPRTQQRYLLPKRLDFANYTIADLHELSADAKLPALRAAGFYTVADIWNVLIRCAHATGEPGLVFIDRINRDNPTPALGPIEATNPCGEQPLLPYESCTLGSINVAQFVTFADGRTALDWPELARIVALAVRFLDNIIDVCNYPVDDTARLARANRKIGLGVMGFADCLFLLGIPYDSRQGVEFGSHLMKFVNDKAHQASAELAEARGPFTNWDGSIWRRKKEKLRNAAITCAAPTGTISIIADCSCGIEPAYSLVFTRQVLDGTKLLEINPIFKKLAEKHGFYSKKLEKQIAKTGSIQRISAIPARIRRIFRSAYDIKPDWHIKMQAAFQDHCDAAVSKTINLPENATVTAVDNAYKTAYRLGCKGITVYRRGSRSREPMTLE
jgi:ribonucleoside-diphosphate reductase alpha chain